MISTPSPPTPPDPKVTASEQTKTNVATAIANAQLSHTNQYNPWGSLTYNQSGTSRMTDQQGNTYDLPTYSATQSLTPQAQALFDAQLANNTALSGKVSQAIANVDPSLSAPVDLSSKNLDNYTNTHWQTGFDRQWNNQRDDMLQKLADQGATPGSPAYERAMQNFATQRQSAEDQYLGDMYNNAQNSIIRQHQLPISDLTSLVGAMQGSSGTQTPNVNGSLVNTPTTTLPTVDYSGLVEQNYQNQMQGYNAQLQASSAAMGGLFGLGGALLGGWMRSDRRAKRDIRKIGEMAHGIGIYSYAYKGQIKRHIGVMADEVEKVMPWAVATDATGYKMVNYDARMI